MLGVAENARDSDDFRVKVDNRLDTYHEADSKDSERDRCYSADSLVVDKHT